MRAVLGAGAAPLLVAVAVGLVGARVADRAAARWRTRCRPGPLPAAVDAFGRTGPGGPAVVRSRLVAAVGVVVGRIGATARRLAARPADLVADRRTGVVVVAALAGAGLGGPGSALAAAGAAWWLPRWWAHRGRRRVEAAIADELPDALDLLTLAVEAGCNLHLALELVSPLAGRAIGGPLADVQARVARGDALGVALDALRPVAALRGLAGCLVDAERFGSPLIEPLQRLAAEARATRRRRAEEAARRLSVTLLFPLVLCVLPAFGLLTVVPVLAGSLESLQLP